MIAANRRSSFKPILLISALALIFSSLPQNAYSAQKITAGATCSKIDSKATYNNKIYTCIKKGKKLVWNSGIAIKTPTASPSPSVQLPKEWSSCPKIGEKIVGSTTTMRCSWAGHANTTEEALNRSLVWRTFNPTKISTSKSNNYKVTPKEGAECTNSGDTFDVPGGILECRFLKGKNFSG